MSTFARGRQAKAQCDRCGNVVKHSTLKNQIVAGRLTNLWVCPDCLDVDQPQWMVKNLRVNDAIALRNPRPFNGHDVDYPYPSNGNTIPPTPAPTPPPISSPFKMFDASNYTGKSETFLRAMTPMFLPPTNIMLAPTSPAPPTMERLLSNAASLANYSGPQAAFSGNATLFFNLDIEIWQIGYAYGGTTGRAWANYVPQPPNLDGGNGIVPDSQATVFMDYFIQVITAMRATYPGITLGVFDELPVVDGPISQLIRLNQRAAYLAAFVDYISPSLYLTAASFQSQFGGPMLPSSPNRIANWVTFATAQIGYARSYNKPVYVYLYPFYVNSAAGYPAIEPEFWQVILDTCYRLADGIILWGGYNLTQPGYVQIPWDDSAAWWVVTQEFMATNNIQQVA